MANYAQLIDVEYVFLNTAVDKNVDPDIITPSIKIAQDTAIQEILGYTLLQNIMGMVVDGSIENPGNIQYKTLLNNFVQPALAHHALYFALPEIQYRLTNKAILAKTSENSQATGLPELKYLRQNAKDIADFYSQRIREEIVNNPNLYPDYFQTLGIERIQPKRTTYYSGWNASGSQTKKKGGSQYGDPDCQDCFPGAQMLNW